MLAVIADGACRRTLHVCISLPKWCRKNAEINMPHFRFTLFLQSPAEHKHPARLVSPTYHERSSQRLIGRAAALVQRASRASEISPFNLWLPSQEKLPFYYSTPLQKKKPFPSNFINNVAADVFGLANPQIQLKEPSQMPERMKTKQLLYSSGQQRQRCKRGCRVTFSRRQLWLQRWHLPDSAAILDFV